MKRTILKRFVMMIILCVSIVIILRFDLQNDKNAIITKLSVNNRINPLGIEGNPVFGWQMQSDISNQRQVAYEIDMALSEKELMDGQYIWSSGRVQSDVSIGIKYEGEELGEGIRYYWQAKVWNQDNDCLISEMAFFETGIFDWSNAKWIAAPELFTTDDRYSYNISYDFYLEKNTSAGFPYCSP